MIEQERPRMRSIIREPTPLDRLSEPARVLLLARRDREQALSAVRVARQALRVFGELAGVPNLGRVVLGQDLLHIASLRLGEPGEERAPPAVRSPLAIGHDAHPNLSPAS